MAYTLTSKSQVTLPKPIRDHLKLAPGDAVDFRITADGSVRVEPVRARPENDEPSEEALARYRKLSGTASTGHTTDELMNMLRGYDDDATDPGFGGTPSAEPTSDRR